MAKQTSGGKGTKNTPAAPQKSKGAAPIVKDKNGNIDPRYGKKIQKEQGVSKQPSTIKRGRGNPLTAAQPKVYSSKNAKDAAERRLKGTYTPSAVEKKKKGRNTGTGAGTLPAVAQPIIIEYNYNEDTGESTPSVVMIPERDVVNLATEEVDASTITNLLFENIGANELVKFVRNDTIEGLNPYYNVISNLTDIRRRFNPSDLISEQVTDVDSEGYSINIDNKIPDQDYLDAQGILDYVYIDDQTGDLVIHVVNMKDSETVEVQIDTNGTIYEVTN